MVSSLLTREGYTKLEKDLEYLQSTRRKQVADRLREAVQGGELIDDAELEAAKNEQSFVEGRIRELEILLANAQVIKESGHKEMVQVGAKVTIQENGNDEEVYTIVGPVEANPREGKISNESPLGIALMERRPGEEVQVKAPGGSFTVHIVKIE